MLDSSRITCVISTWSYEFFIPIIRVYFEIKLARATKQSSSSITILIRHVMSITGGKHCICLAVPALCLGTVHAVAIPLPCGNSVHLGEYGVHKLTGMNQRVTLCRLGWASNRYISPFHSAGLPLYGRTLPGITVCALSVQIMLVLPTATLARGRWSSLLWTHTVPRLPSLGAAGRGTRGKATALLSVSISHWTLGPHTLAMEQQGSLPITLI